MTQTQILRWQDVDAFIQSFPGTSGRVRRQKLLWFVYWEHYLRTGESLFQTTWLRYRLGPVSAELHAGYDEPNGNTASLGDAREAIREDIEHYSGLHTNELVNLSHGGPYAEQSELRTEITERDQKTARKNRWTNTFESRCRLYRGKPCTTYSHHVKSQGREIHGQQILKQVLRVLEDFARRGQPVFAEKEYYLTRVRKPDGSPCSWRMIRHCLQLILSLGWWKKSADGLVMVPHNEFATMEGNHCILRLPEFRLSSSRVPVEFQLSSGNRGSEFRLSSGKCDSEFRDNGSKPLTIKAITNTEPASAPPLVNESLLVNESMNQRVTESAQNAQGKSNGKTNGSLRSFQTYDHDQNPAGKFKEAEPELTVGDALRVVRNLDDLELIQALSDGEFDTRALKNYEHTDELANACKDAIADMSEKEFRGRVTLADVMGRAMERLRKDYDFDAPKGWLPVMQKLREKSTEIRPRIEHAPSHPAPQPPRYSHDVGKPEDWFELPYVQRVWSAVGSPVISDEWKENLIAVAREVGSPTEHDLGVGSFLYEAEKRFGKLPDNLKRMYDYSVYKPNSAVQV